MNLQVILTDQEFGTNTDKLDSMKRQGTIAVLLAAAHAISASSIISSGNTTITVSGLSGGAYMAVQYHVAFSATVSGVGALAGGPYYCAINNVGLALGRCSA